LINNIAIFLASMNLLSNDKSFQKAYSGDFDPVNTYRKPPMTLTTATCATYSSAFVQPNVQGGSDKSGIFFFFLLSGTTQLKINRFY
jgi:hypothetical protein